MFTLSSFAFALAIVGTQAQSYYRWKGSNVNFDNDLLWSGPNPRHAVPSETAIGRGLSEVQTVSNLPAGDYTIGEKLIFDGKTKLFLGDGKPNGKATRILFGNGGTEKTRFTYPESLSDNQGTYFDYNCHLNWERVQRTSAILVDQPPCGGIDVQIPEDGNSYFISTYGNGGAAKKIKYGDDVIAVSRADLSQDTSYPVSWFIKDPFQFKFGGFCEERESTCKGTDVILSDGSTLNVQYGERNKTATIRKPNGDIVDASDKVTVDSENGEISVVTDGDKTIVVDKSGLLITSTPTSSPSFTPSFTPTASPVGSESSLLSGNSGIAIFAGIGGAVILIIIISVFIFCFVFSRKESPTEKPAISFENPMYDNVNEGVDEDQLAREDDTGLYDDPNIPNNTGYMDIPAKENTDGYMDVPPNENENVNIGTSGYMDVSANPNVYDDVDDESDQEDF